MSSLTARVFVLIFSLFLSINIAQAGGWGHGPNFGGYEPFHRPIPDKPLDGAKQAAQDAGSAIEKAGKAVGPVIARPFEETAKSIKDPWGWQKRTERWKDEGLAAAEKAKKDALDFADKVLAAATKEMRIAIGALTGVSILAIAAYFFRRRTPRRTKRRTHKVHPLHA